jgi:hypothetical protein
MGAKGLKVTIAESDAWFARDLVAKWPHKVLDLKLTSTRSIERMKILSVLAVTLPWLVTAAFSQSHQSPFACDRMALNAQERKRHFDELGPQLRGLVKRVREVADGYEFEFNAGRATIQTVAEWAPGEHLCCPFFDIDLRLEKEGGAFWLRLTGREGVKQFIKADFSRWFNTDRGSKTAP